jgi:GT2 family glycosyltransferase
MPEKHRLSVVIITRDRLALLSRTLSQLALLPERPEVIVVDNGSRQSVRPTVRSVMPAARVISLPVNIGAGARNIGVRQSEAEFVAFCDDDSWWTPGSLARAAAIMESDERIGLLAARVEVQPQGVTDPVSQLMAAGPLADDLQRAAGGRRAVTGFLACASVVRARAFLAVGGFCSTLGIGGEEQMVAWDLWSSGWKALYTPEICAVHHPQSLDARPGRRRLLARNDLWAAWQRLPPAQLADRTRDVVMRSVRDPAALAGAMEAVGGIRFAWSRRAPIPAPVAAARLRVEHEPLDSSGF